MKLLRKIVVSTTLFGYILLSVFGLVAMQYIHQHSSMAHCPFMVGEHSLCTMDFNEHINAWQTTTITILTDLMVLIVPLLFIFVLRWFGPPNLARSKLFEKPHRERFITTLFSQGILHPKAP